MRVAVSVQQLRRRVPGGIGTYAKGLLKGFGEVHTDGEVSLALLASRMPSGAGSDPVGELGYPVVASRLPAKALTRAWDWGVVRAPGGFDLVHSVSLGGPRGPRCPAVTTVHDTAWRDFPETFPGRGRRWHDAALARAIASSSALVVPSQATASAVVDAGASATIVEVIEEGSDHLPPPDDRATSELLCRLGVTGPFILSVGTLEPRKNLVRVLAAYSRVRASLPEPWPLVIVGPPGWGPGTEAPPGALSAGRVEGAVLAALYGRARCLVYAPLGEGFGLPALEAMAKGTPVVASPVPSAGDAAWEVDPLEERSIADGILAAAADEGARVDLVARGRRRAGGLTWARTASQHLELWRDVVAGGRRWSR